MQEQLKDFVISGFPCELGRTSGENNMLNTLKNKKNLSNTNSCLFFSAVNTQCAPLPSSQLLAISNPL